MYIINSTLKISHANASGTYRKQNPASRLAVIRLADPFQRKYVKRIEVGGEGRGRGGGGRGREGRGEGRGEGGEGSEGMRISRFSSAWLAQACHRSSSSERRRKNTLEASDVGSLSRGYG